jgi:hypothetical protein
MANSPAQNASPNPSAGSATGGNQNIQQYGRTCTLLVSNNQGQALDLSALRIKFKVKKTGVMTPNAGDIIVYNVDPKTEKLIQNEFTHVILQAGYLGNYGLIFKGNIKQFITGRESAIDTFINLNCGDGDQAYNFATINQTLKAGAAPQAQLNAAITSMASMGIGAGYTGALPQVALPRGKVIYSNARDHLKKLADTYGFTWSIQDGNVVFLSQGAYLPNQAVVITSKTGMIGTPQQTPEGIDVKCLLNPNIKVHSRIQLNNAAIAKMKIDFWTPGSPANTPSQISQDGMYYALLVEHSGDTRGQDWYSNLRLLTVDVSSNPLTSVQVGYGS